MSFNSYIGKTIGNHCSSTSKFLRSLQCIYTLLIHQILLAHDTQYGEVTSLGKVYSSFHLHSFSQSTPPPPFFWPCGQTGSLIHCVGLEIKPVVLQRQGRILNLLQHLRETPSQHFIDCLLSARQGAKKCECKERGEGSCLSLEVRGLGLVEHINSEQAPKGLISLLPTPKLYFYELSEIM